MISIPVVICRELTESCFSDCLGVVNDLTGEALGLPGKSVYVNSTLGPLKFDSEEQVVVHLMIYDVAGHREHVLKRSIYLL